MKMIQRNQHDFEVQGISEGTTITLHLMDGRKIVVENGASSGTSGDIFVTVNFGDSSRVIPVYDQHGEEIAVLKESQ